MVETRGVRRSGSQISSRTSSVVSLDPLSLDGSDPLSHFARIDSFEVDPLTKLAHEYVSVAVHISNYELQLNIHRLYSQGSTTTTASSKSKDKQELIENSLENHWNSRKASILSKYTTAEKLTIVSSFLHGGELVKTQITFSEKVKNRLEQLDDFEDGSVRRVNDLTQQEYQFRIEQLNQELIQAWKTDQRVKALKIAIQCTKVLADTSVISFYPSQFVLITDILDNFGKLVFERLRTKADYYE